MITSSEIVYILFWIGMWGMTEIIISLLSGDNNVYRFGLYLTLVIIAFIILRNIS